MRSIKCDPTIQKSEICGYDISKKFIKVYSNQCLTCIDKNIHFYYSKGSTGCVSDIS